MPNTGRVPPGRAGLLWLRHRLAIATRGVDLLQRKLAILSTEEQRLRLLTGHTAQQWEEDAARADRWLVRAALLGGQPTLRMAALRPTAEVTPTWTVVMGVRYPAEPDCRLPDRPSDAPPVGTAALVIAERAYREAVPAALRHAAATAALRCVEVEVATTRQRVRALEQHWIPRLQAALALARLQMEELEHSDTVRRRWTSPATPTAREGDRVGGAGAAQRRSWQRG